MTPSSTHSTEHPLERTSDANSILRGPSPLLSRGLSSSRRAAARASAAAGRAAAGGAGGSGAAPARRSSRRARIKVDLVAVQPDWTKVCGYDPQPKKEVCYTTRDFGAQADQPLLALAVYDLKGDDTKVIRLLLPPGLMLSPGFRFAVDKGPLEAGAFEICFPNGCFAEAKVKAAVVDGMKKGEKLTIIVKNQVNAEVTFILPLAGFGKAFDGPAIDPKVLEEQQKKLQEELQKKAEEERKKLEAQKPRCALPARTRKRIRAPLPARAGGGSARSRVADRTARSCDERFRKSRRDLDPEPSGSRDLEQRKSHRSDPPASVPLERPSRDKRRRPRARRSRRPADGAPDRRMCRAPDFARTHRRHIPSPHFPRRDGRRADPYAAALLREWTATIPRCSRTPGSTS